jgi:multidrug efflux pump subunit AcrB
MIERSVRHGTQLAVVVLTICVLGVLAAFRVPVQMIPDLEIRTITVQTRWPGATPQDVEKEILIEQEEYLRTIPTLQRMISTSSSGEAVIELEFGFGVDIGDALIRVNNALSQVPDYPENVDEPRLYASSFSQNAFMFFRVEPMPEHPIRLDMDMMRDFIDDNVRTRMERVPGVSEVRIGSGAERQIQVEVDPGRLAATGLTLTDLRDAIRNRNRDVTAGDVDSGNRRYLLRTVGRFASLAELEELILARRGDTLVRLRDIGKVRLDHFELSSKTFVNGEPAFNLMVRREIGSNVIAIKDAMMAEVEEIERDVLAPAGLQMTLTADDVGYVRESIENVWTNLAIGALLASVVMFLFLRSLSATLVGVVGIPICTLAAFIGLLAAGRTINVISLAGVAFAIGMTLDNGIVVLESIERARRRGLDRFEAALAGVRRVWPAVLAATLTTVLVFAPVLFVREEAGQLFSDIAIAISAAIIASMLVAITVVPSASARVRLPRAEAANGAAPGAFFRAVVAGVRWLVATWPRRIVGFGLPLAGTLAIIVLLTPPGEYLPEGEEAKTFSLMIAPPGYNFPAMSAIAEEVQEVVLPHVKADAGAFERGETGFPPIAWFLLSVSAKRLFVVSETVEPKNIDALMSALNALFRQYPGMRAFSARGSIISSNDGGTRSVNLDIAGVELRAIYDTALAAYRRAEQVFENPQIGSDPPSLSLDQPLIEFVPRWARVAELGFTADEVGFALSALSDGAYVDEALLDGERIDIFLYSAAGSRQSLGNLANLPLYTPEGAIVPAAAIADLVERVDTDSVRRVDGRRTVTLNIIPPRSVALETAVGIVQREVIDHLRASGEVGAGVTLDISGASDQMDSTRRALLGNFVVSLILCYLVLVAIFTHWGYPLVIMTTVPLGIAGGIVGLWLLNTVGAALPAFGIAPIRQSFDMITMLGFLILLGTVVNNPILIVDQTLRYIREEGLLPRVAVPQAVASRLRPMMMATITTVFGIAPLVFLPGAGTELYRGVGAIVLFGLLFASMITVVFLPPLLVMVLELARGLGVGDGEAAGDDEDSRADTDNIRRIGERD